MTRETTITILGLLAALSPFLGLPYKVLMWVVLGLGLLIALLAFTSRRAR